MYEHYIAAYKNGVTDIEINVNETDCWQTSEEDDVQIDASEASVTVTFAVNTDATAAITIRGDGLVYPSFGGTGVIDSELDRYAAQAVRVWRAVTDDTDTTCRYKVRDPDSQDQADPKHIIDA